MKSIKKIAILFICLALALNLFLVGGPVKTDYDSNYLLPKGSYDDILSFWGNSLTASAEAVENNKSNATPGEENTLYGTTGTQYPSTKLINKASFKYYYEGSNYAYGIDKDGNEVISYKHANGQYLDMINGAGSVLLKSHANLEASSKKIVSSDTVNTFEEGTDANGNKILTVTYTLSGSAANTSAVTVQYTFGYSAITVKYDIQATSSTTINGSFSSVIRNYINDGYRKRLGILEGNIDTKSKVVINSQWIYPENLDYPYQDFEGLIYIDEFEQGVKMYTSLREPYTSKSQHMVENMDGDSLGLGFQNGTSVDKELEYTISFADATAEEQNPDYLGLFRGKKQEFAAGITPVDASGNTLITKESDHSTVFAGDSIDLNINVTNISDKSVTFSLRYDVRDYYGNVVDKGLFVDNEILPALDANRTVSVTGKYGMYYLNLYVISEGGDTYQECYPFALIPEHNYSTYRASNPFGFASAAAGKNPDGANSSSDFTLSKYINTADLMAKKLGVATVRASSEPGYVAMMKTLKSYGITKMNGGIVNTNFGLKSEVDITSADTIAAYKQRIRNSLNATKDEDGNFLIDSAEVGNEMSLYALKDKNNAEDNGYIPIEQLYPIFYEYTHKPALEVFNEEAFAGKITYIPTQSSACETSWLNNFVTETYTSLASGSISEENTKYAAVGGIEVNSIWSDIKILTAHIYAAAAIMPDVYGGFTVSRGGDMWNIEAGVQRIYDFLEANKVDGQQKDFYFTEVGYSTAPLSKGSPCLRTQADYYARIGAIVTAYGVDRVQYYQFYDRTSYNSGYNNSNGEFNFGAFYQQDYYGVIKPKPAGIAFAIMTQQLESMKKNGGSICEKYDKGFDTGDVRAFVYDTAAFGDVVVAYSNQEVLSNGRKNNDRGATNLRTPTLPWNSQWLETDSTEFETEIGATVTIIDVMGNETQITDTDNDGKVTIELTGSPVYIHGVVTTGDPIS